MAYPTGELSVDLHAIVANWLHMNQLLKGESLCGAVVKANAYGLGVDRIAPRIYAAGCRHFFVANLKEAIQLQSLVGLDATIYVLTGCIAGAEQAFASRGLVPVIVSAEMLRRWVAANKRGVAPKSVLKVNTGMGRLGLDLRDFNALLQEKSLLRAAGITYLMSHLSCAETIDHPLNALQMSRFLTMKQQLVDIGLSVKTTLANSAGVFLGRDAQCDLVRPGISLYGGNPGVSVNPMRSVVGLNLPLIQLRRLAKGEYVGYGATKCFDSDRLIAVAAGGYADGVMRSLSNKGWGFCLGEKAPIVGRVSMDSTMFDVTDIAGAQDLKEGDPIELLGDNVSIDDLAQAADTISYEILTSIGSRYQRSYIE